MTTNYVVLVRHNSKQFTNLKTLLQIRFHNSNSIRCVVGLSVVLSYISWLSSLVLPRMTGSPYAYKSNKDGIVYYIFQGVMGRNFQTIMYFCSCRRMNLS